MRIVTLNTWKNEGQYERRLALMAKGLGALAPDIVCLQECFVAKGHDTAAYLAAELGLRLTAAPARRKLRQHLGETLPSASGLAILHRNAPLATGRLDLPSDPVDGQRIAQWADVAPGLRVLNLHLTHLGGPEAARLRASQLVQAMTECHRPGQDLLVAGDLNASGDAPELAPIAADLDPTAVATLQGERADRAPSPSRTLDHLALVQPKAWTITARFRALDQPDAEGWFPSDHAAVVADLARL